MINIRIKFHKVNSPTVKILHDIIQLYHEYLKDVNISYERYKQGLSFTHIISARINDGKQEIQLFDGQIFQFLIQKIMSDQGEYQQMSEHFPRNSMPFAGPGNQNENTDEDIQPKIQLSTQPTQPSQLVQKGNSSGIIDPSQFLRKMEQNVEEMLKPGRQSTIVNKDAK